MNAFLARNKKTFEYAAYAVTAIGGLALHYYGNVLPLSVVFPLDLALSALTVLRADGLDAAILVVLKGLAPAPKTPQAKP